MERLSNGKFAIDISVFDNDDYVLWILHSRGYSYCTKGKGKFIIDSLRTWLDLHPRSAHRFYYRVYKKFDVVKFRPTNRIRGTFYVHCVPEARDWTDEPYYYEPQCIYPP